MMQVLTDAQWAKFEAAIVAVQLRGARPRKEDGRTIEAIIWRLDNGAKCRSIPAELGDWKGWRLYGLLMLPCRR
jgi:transposase